MVATGGLPVSDWLRIVGLSLIFFIRESWSFTGKVKENIESKTKDFYKGDENVSFYNVQLPNHSQHEFGLFLISNTVSFMKFLIGPLQDPVTWYGINYTGTQMTQWDFQNKRTLTSPTRLSFVLKVPLRLHEVLNLVSLKFQVSKNK